MPAFKIALQFFLSSKCGIVAGISIAISLLAKNSVRKSCFFTVLGVLPNGCTNLRQRTRRKNLKNLCELRVLWGDRFSRLMLLATSSGCRAEFGDSRYNKVNLCNYAGSLRDLQNDKVRWIKKGVKRNAKITPFLWFDNQAEEALNFYASIFNNSRIGSITRYGAGGPGPAGTVMTATFQLEGQEFMALNGGPEFTFTPAKTFFVNCETHRRL